MIIYRPHRGGIAEAMEEAREFKTIDEMKAYIVLMNTDRDYGQAFCADDIILGNEPREDYRIGWKDVNYVYVTHYYSERYNNPIPIGYYATEYNSLEKSQRMCKEFLEGKYEMDQSDT